MTNRILVYSVSTFAVILLFATFLFHSSFVYGQTATTGGQNTFSAKGSIDSLVVKDGGQQIPMQFNEQTSYILDGNWKLQVVNGNVTDFGTWLTMVHFDGTNRHSMAFMNFKQDNSTAGAIQVQPDGSATIQGIVDVLEGKEVKWSNVNTQLSINKYNTINISVDNQQTDEHFNGQPVRGIVDAFLYGFMDDKMKKHDDKK
jgi:hypothetical protein